MNSHPCESRKALRAAGRSPNLALQMNSTAQINAIKAKGNVLVVAGAGTGKTSTLVGRTLHLLENGGSIERILMVTFTEAAATEMRTRIRQALESRIAALEIAGDAELQQHFQKQLALLDTALISTLHGFCLQLIREHFYELELDPEISVLDETQTHPMIEQLLGAIFEAHYAGKTGNAAEVQKLIRVQGRGSDERIREFILKLHRYTQSLANPAKWLRDQKAIFSSPEPVQWRQWFIEGFVEWRKLWVPALKEFSETPAVALVIAALEKNPTKTDLPEISRALGAIFEADENGKNWPRGSKGKVRNQIKDFFEEAEFLKSLVPKNENDPLAEDWNLVRHGMETLLNLTIEFTGKFDAAKRQSAGLDFADLEQFALRVLRDSETGAPTPAALEWRQRLDYIFVDECQDINAAQDAILTALSRDGADANRFLVGDVKQSIYRFRLADPGIFRRYETNWSNGAPHSQRLPLSDNFRSHKGILDFINPLFRALMRQSFGGVSYEELIFGNAAERAALLEKKIGEPRVEFHLIAKGEPENSTGEENAGDENNEQYGQSTSAADLLATEREARMVAIRLRELKENGREIWDKEKKQFRPVQWSDMAVLLRSPSSRVEAFAKEFDKAGVPLEAARAGFFASAEITDLVCLLKLLDNPLQDIPLLAALHSPLVGMSFSELAEIRANETPASRAKFFWMTARDFHRRGDKSSSAWRKLDAFFAQLHRWRERVRQSSVSHCLETALTETHYELLLRAGIRGEQQIANVRRFLDLARQYDPFQRQGLFRFLRFIQAQEKHDLELDSAPANRDAVRLMSIHKSKGLEFPVVALAGLGWKFNFRDLDENILLDEIFGLCPKVAPAKNAQTYPSLPWWLARRRQRGEMLGEELRLLYVAMTRARDTLLLAATAPRKGNPKWDAAEPREWRDEELLSARCCFDWLKPWFSQMTRETDWTSECGGATQLFRWTIYDENDPRLELKNLERIGSKSFTEKPNHLDESALAKISERVNWIYPWNSATGQRAKTSVTELRRQRDGDEESEIAPFARRNVFTLESKKNGLSAAEIGVAHHRFLQRVSLEKTGGADALKSEAERLRAEKFLSEREVESLDFVALEKFWRSDFGRNIVANAGNVRRELEFSAAFSAADLVATSLASAAKLPPDDFVLVQGIVDLAVILPGEIRIVDFKTDAVTEAELERKTKQYEPQLKLYALALERSFRLPVTQCALYFLSAHRLAQVRI